MQSPLDYVDWTSCADALSANPFKVYASSTVVHWFIALVPPQLWRATTEKNLGSAPVESTWNRKTCISIPFLTLHVVWLRPNVEEKWAICTSLNTVRKLVYSIHTIYIVTSYDNIFTNIHVFLRCWCYAWAHWIIFDAAFGWTKPLKIKKSNQVLSNLSDLSQHMMRGRYDPCVGLSSHTSFFWQAFLCYLQYNYRNC